MQLFDLGFFVDHMLADDWIKFLHLELVRRRSLVLAGGVEMSRPGRRNHPNLVSHVVYSLA